MTVRVRFFATLRERLRTTEASRDLPPGATVGDLVRLLHEQFPDLAASGRVAIAVNAEYVDPRHPLSDGDEVALIPPVSGGCPGGAGPA